LYGALDSVPGYLGGSVSIPAGWKLAQEVKFLFRLHNPTGPIDHCGAAGTNYNDRNPTVFLRPFSHEEVVGTLRTDGSPRHTTA